VTIRLGTRASALALAQSGQIADALRAHGVECELVEVRTSGDGPGAATDGDKSRWVDGLERALLAGEIDVAVHSAKDVPGEPAEGMAILAVPAREDARDALCGAGSLSELAPGACIGTTSLRRAAQLRAVRPDVDVVELRGNVDTRLRKLVAGECDAAMLAVAGLRRLGRADAADGILEPADGFVPAPGQGALALEARAGDAVVVAALASIDDVDTHAALLAERAVARTLGASCNTPIGANAQIVTSGELELVAWVGAVDGSTWIADRVSGSREDPEALGERMAGRLLAAGAGALLRADTLI
jgi:hydroxymethylbilane synthase